MVEKKSHSQLEKNGREKKWLYTFEKWLENSQANRFGKYERVSYCLRKSWDLDRKVDWCSNVQRKGKLGG